MPTYSGDIAPGYRRAFCIGRGEALRRALDEDLHRFDVSQLGVAGTRGLLAGRAENSSVATRSGAIVLLDRTGDYDLG
jgi:hypothetical protein